jgi:hypothetical protein
MHRSDVDVVIGDGGGGPLGGNGGLTLDVGVMWMGLTDTFLPLILIALALGGLIVFSRDSDAVQTADSGAASGVQNTLDDVPFISPAIGGATAGVIRSISQLSADALEKRTTALSLIGAIAIGAVQTGIIELPEKKK